MEVAPPPVAGAAAPAPEPSSAAAAAPAAVVAPAGSGAASEPPHPSHAMQAPAPITTAPPGAGVTTVQPAKRRKGGRRGGGLAVAAAGAAVDGGIDLVRLGAEIPRNSERLRTGWYPVQLSDEDKAAEVELDERQVEAASCAGYRMVRATHGACSGTWYFEVRIDRLGPTGAARVGWCTRQAELNAPVGADEHGFSYRSTQGSKVHKAWRDDYGEPYGEGDVVGCLLHLPEGGRPFELGVEDVVKYKGKHYFAEPHIDQPPTPQPLQGAFVAFARNGVLQGKAYVDIKEGTYYPALSLYTNKALQQQAARATANFGENSFAFPPPTSGLEGCPPPRPAFELSGPRPGAASALNAAAPAAANGMAAASQQQQQVEQEPQQAAPGEDAEQRRQQQQQPPPQQQAQPDGRPERHQQADTLAGAGADSRELQPPPQQQADQMMQEQPPSPPRQQQQQQQQRQQQHGEPLQDAVAGKGEAAGPAANAADAAGSLAGEQRAMEMD